MLKGAWMRVVLSTLRIVFAYAVFSTLWILFSDTLLHYLVEKIGRAHV